MRKASLVFAMLAAALVVSQPAAAISNGVLDGTSHPNVGVIVLEGPDGEIFELCSGVLISPTAFLTVPGCAGNVAFAQSFAGRAAVSFDAVFDPDTSKLLDVS